MFRLLVRSGELVQLIVFVAVGCLFWIPAFMQPAPVVRLPLEGPLFTLIANLTFSLSYVSLILELVFVIAIAFFLNLYLISNNLIPSNNYLPAILAIFFLSYDTSIQALNPIVPASVFMLICIHYLAVLYNQQSPATKLFSIGFTISIASLIYVPFVILLPAVFMALLTLRITSLREWLIPVFSFLLPVVYWISFSFLTDRPFPIDSILYKTAVQFMFIHELKYSLLYAYATQWLFLLITAISSLSLLDSKLISIRKRTWIFAGFLFFAGILLLFSGKTFSYVNSALAIFLAAFYTIYHVNKKYAVIFDILFTVYVASLVLIRFVKL